MEQEHARVLAELDRIDRMTPEELRGEQPVAGHHPPSAVSATASATASATVPAPAAGGDAQKSHPPSSGGSRPRVGRSGLSAAAASFTPGSG